MNEIKKIAEKPIKAEQINPLNLELVELYDDFSAFNSNCAFVCNAFSALAEQTYEEGDPAIRGMQMQVNSLKNKMQEFVIRLKEVQSKVKEQYS